MFHYVYRITNTTQNKHYYGKRSCNNLPKNDLGVNYFSSSRDKLFIQDQKQNPQNYKYKIIRVFDTSNDALSFEIKLHVKFDVGINENFYNKSKQTSVGFSFNGSGKNNPMYGKTGALNPMYGKTHSDESKQRMSEKQTGKGNSQHETCWVHNFDGELKEIPVKIKLSELDSYLKNGYFKGRTNKTKFKEIRFKNRKTITKPITKPIKQIRYNEKIRIFHPVLCEVIVIRKEFVFDYIIDGWLIIPKSMSKGTTKLNKNKININLSLDTHIAMFINKGWILGFHNPNHKGTSGKTYSWIDGKKIFN